MCVLLRWKSFYSHMHAQNKHINQWTKADKASHKHIKIQLQELSCTSKEISPAHSMLPFVICGTRIKERWPASALPSRPAGSPALAPNPGDRAMLGHPPSSRLPPWSAPLFPHLINLSAKPFDTRHNMVPVFLGLVFPSFNMVPLLQD